MAEQESAAKRSVDLLRELAGANDTRELIRDTFDKINEAFRKDGSKSGDGRRRSLNVAALARHLHYYLLAEADEARTGTTKHLTPSWASLAEKYNIDFLPRAGKELELPQIDKDELAGLCNFDTRRQGFRKRNLYSGLALFLVDMYEDKKLDREFMRFAIPVSEVSFVDQLRTLFSMTASGKRALPDEPNGDEEGYAEIQVRFSYNRAKLQNLEEFHDHFKAGEDVCAHFICYRPRKSNPLELMKTFMAIKPPKALDFPDNAASSSFNFVHVYKRTPASKTGRISLGKVIPLDEGLYLVGGQRLMGRDRAPLPFKTLKVVAMEWAAVERRDCIIPGLVMSANHDGEHIVSRMAIRATPIEKSDHIKLGPVKLSDLAKDIEADRQVERQLLTAYKASDEEFDKFELARSKKDDKTLPAIFSKVLDLTNNDSQWDLPSGYRVVKGSKTLSAAQIRQDLEGLYGASNSPKFKSKDGEAFDFGSSLRFLPLFKKKGAQ